VSMQAALEYLALEKKRRGGRLLAVMGDMLELGDYAREGHERVGGVAAREGYERLFVLGDHATDVARGAMSEGMKDKNIKTYKRGDHTSLIDDLASEVHTGDCVLIKGSRGVRMEQVARALLGSNETE